MRYFIKWFFIVVILTLLSGCVTSPPEHTENICQIFKQYPKWYWSTQDVEKEWGVPIYVQMAILYQESGFHATAKPARKKLLGFIPWKHPTTAYGYSQALNHTWKDFRISHHRYDARRTQFDDAVDFIGWYAWEAKKKLGIDPHDAFNLYLAYHEGLGGYVNRTYRKKPWLIRVSRRVAMRAELFKTQLNQCRSQLKNKPWYHFW